jgi:hypothetical protein
MSSDTFTVVGMHVPMASGVYPPRDRCPMPGRVSAEIGRRIDGRSEAGLGRPR